MKRTTTLTPTQIFEARVKDFMDTFEQTRYKNLESVPIPTIMLRAKLIAEESREYHAARQRGTEELDGICDLIYVVVGTNLVGNLRVDPYVTEVKPKNYWAKVSIFPEVYHLTQELDTRFPCPKRTREYCNEILQRLVDIAAIQGYNLLRAFEAVHANNMDKLWPEAPKDNNLTAKRKGEKWLVMNADGKVVKSPDHKKVDLAPYL